MRRAVRGSRLAELVSTPRPDDCLGFLAGGEELDGFLGWVAHDCPEEHFAQANWQRRPGSGSAA